MSIYIMQHGFTHTDISGHVLLPEMSLGNQVMKVQVKAFLLKHLDGYIVIHLQVNVGKKSYS